MALSPVVFAPSKPAGDAEQASAGVFSAAQASAGSLASVEQANERSEHYANRSKSQATINAYATGWRDFLEFCRLRDLLALPATEQTWLTTWPGWQTTATRGPSSPAAWSLSRKGTKRLTCPHRRRHRWCAAPTPSSAVALAPRSGGRLRPWWATSNAC